MSKLTGIIETLAIALRDITIEHGYNTDIGLHVFTEIVERLPTDAPAITVMFKSKQAKSDGMRRPNNTRRVTGIISVTVPSSFPKSTECALLAEEDVERRLTLNPPMMPGALPIQIEGTTILYPEAGLPVLIVEIEFSTEYRA